MCAHAEAKRFVTSPRTKATALGSKQLVPQTRLPTPCQRRRSFVKCALVQRWNSQVELASLGFALSVPAWVPVGLCLSILGVSRLAQKVSMDAVLEKAEPPSRRPNAHLREEVARGAARISVRFSVKMVTVTPVSETAKPSSRGLGITPCLSRRRATRRRIPVEFTIL